MFERENLEAYTDRRCIPLPPWFHNEDPYPHQGWRVNFWQFFQFWGGGPFGLASYFDPIFLFLGGVSIEGS